LQVRGPSPFQTGEIMTSVSQHGPRPGSRPRLSPSQKNREAGKITLPPWEENVMTTYIPLLASSCAGCSTRKVLPPFDQTSTSASCPLGTLLSAF
jgi:hypothetical protein